MEQGLIDIRNKAMEQAIKFGEYSPYNISCGTLIAILNELESSLSCDYTDCKEPVRHITCRKHHDEELI